jgi:hypothetical protein
MNRYHLLAAEVFGSSYANYQDHLNVRNLRYTKLMPDDARTLERADAEGWPVGEVARVLKVEPEDAAELVRAFRRARDVVDAKDAATSFRWGVRQSVERALAEGLGDEASVERLVTQICYRAADLAFLLEREGEPLSRYSRELRKEPGVTYYDGDLDEPEGGP